MTEKRLAQLHEQLPKFKERMRKGQKLKGDERRYLSLTFARALATSYPFNGVLKALPSEIVKRLVEYLQLTPEEQTAEESGEGKTQKRDPSR